jgi:hypothetical protein
MKTLTASDRAALIRMASSLEAGSEERKTLLAGLQASGGVVFRVVSQQARARKDYDSLADMSRDFRQTGVSRDTGPIREELRSQPKFQGLLGPMWGGLEGGKVVLRYEDQSSYRTLSRAASSTRTSGRSTLIRLASSMTPGSDKRKEILAGLKLARTVDFDFEGSDFGVRHWRRRRDDLVVYWPLANIGKRGKRVNMRSVTVEGERTAWGHTFMDQVKRASNAKQANEMLTELLGEIRAAGEGNHVWSDRTDEVKGVDASLPTPSADKIEDIEGPDIQVDMNAKPIQISSKSHSKDLVDMRMTYWFRVHQKNRKKLHALRDELAAARDADAAMKILTDEGIKYDYHSYMMPGWD